LSLGKDSHSRNQASQNDLVEPVEISLKLSFTPARETGSLFCKQIIGLRCIMRLILCLSAILPMTVVLGCHPRNHTERGAMVGSTAGALLGGIIGHQSGNTGDGVVLGALAGGLTGAVVGNSEDKKDMAYEELAQAEMAAATAVTNLDLIRMTQSGVSDDVIINTVKTRGGRIDLSPSAVIDLKANGVSDHVVLEIQKASQSAARGEVVRVVSSRPEITVVPSVGVGVGVSQHRHPYWHRPRPRTGVHLHYSR
jgi:uncharacterized protein YcfJ